MMRSGPMPQIAALGSYVMSIHSGLLAAFRSCSVA
jgi:hypothetical protein